MIRIINARLIQGLYWTTAFTAFLFFAMVCINVFTRYILKTPFLASIELSRLFFIWSCFLAAAITFYRRGHIAISFLTDRLPAIWAIRTSKIIDVLTLIFFIGLIFWSFRVVVLIWYTEFPILGISQGWIYMPLIPVSVIMAFITLEHLIDPLNQSKSG